MTVEQIARVCHEAVRAYARSAGDHSIRSWRNSHAQIKESAIIGVQNVIANPNTTAKESHDLWVRVKKSQGWVYGPEKDAEEKTHPCIVPYAELSAFQRKKDDLFIAIVKALAPTL